jgi:hypothetical protein
MVFEIIEVEKYQNMGFDTQADGTADVWWKGSINDLGASAKVSLAPPRPSGLYAATRWTQRAHGCCCLAIQAFCPR